MDTRDAYQSCSWGPGHRPWQQVRGLKRLRMPPGRSVQVLAPGSCAAVAPAPSRWRAVHAAVRLVRFRLWQLA